MAMIMGFLSGFTGRLEGDLGGDSEFGGFWQRGPWGVQKAGSAEGWARAAEGSTGGRLFGAPLSDVAGHDVRERDVTKAMNEQR